MSVAVRAVEAYELELDVEPAPRHVDLLAHLERGVRAAVPAELAPIRLAVTRSGPDGYHCEAGVLGGGLPVPSIFELRRRTGESASAFTTVFVVPTGIGSEVGGHAGDATPAAELLASVSDVLVTHPNVVNASDLNELPSNALYVEGSVLASFLLGTVGLERVRSNRVLVVADAHPDPVYRDQCVNAVNAARATLGLECPEVVLLDPPLEVEAHYAPSGRAAGRVGGLERLLDALDERRGLFDVVAISTRIALEPEHRLAYYGGRERVNPWGGVEAILTHAVSGLYGVPTAHSPMFESREIARLEFGVVDARMAAEAISISFFVSVLKGLQRSPRIVPPVPGAGRLTAEDVSCLVLPDGALGLPTLAALEQGIPVVAVREAANLMENDLAALPWRPGQLHVVGNYWEAAGVVACLRAGLSPGSVRRPLRPVAIGGEH
jgi:hypothetical protein